MSFNKIERELYGLNVRKVEINYYGATIIKTTYDNAYRRTRVRAFEK